MKASEARQLTNKNGVSLTDALKSIENQASRGANSALFDNMNTDTLQRLFDLGYSISKLVDSIGFNKIKIEW